MAYKKCQWCGKQFSTADGLLQMFTGVAKYCSKKCESDSQQSIREEDHYSHAIPHSQEQKSDRQKWQDGEMSVEEYLRRKNDPTGNLTDYHFKQLSLKYDKTPPIVYGGGFEDVNGNECETIIIGQTEWCTEDYLLRGIYKGRVMPAEGPYGYLLGYLHHKIMPSLKDGWRLPNDNDWINLEDYFGGDPYANIALLGYWNDYSFQYGGIHVNVPESWKNTSQLSLKEEYWGLDINNEYFNYTVNTLSIHPFRLDPNKYIDEWDDAGFVYAVRLVRDVQERNSVAQMKPSKESINSDPEISPENKENKNETEFEKLKRLLEEGAINQDQYMLLKKDLEIKALNELLRSKHISEEQFSILLRSINTPEQ